jgi:hypothetical protein
MSRLAGRQCVAVVVCLAFSAAAPHGQKQQAPTLALRLGRGVSLGVASVLAALADSYELNRGK